jgi:hypothetical protein
MKMDLNQIIAVLKQALGLAAVVMIAVAVLRAFGVHLDFVKIGGTELAAISAAAAYISR